MSGVLIASILVFLAIVLGAVGLIAMRQETAARALGRRLFGRSPQGRAGDVQRDQRYSAVPPLDRLLRRLDLGRRLELLIYMAGMDLRPGVLILSIAAFGIGGYMLGTLFLHKVGLGLLLMVVAGSLPYLNLLYRKHVRMRAFAREFPDAIDLLVSALRAGLSFTAAMQIVSEESPDPVRTEFAIAVEEQALGVDLREALTNLTERVDSLDLRFFVTAVLLQRETGGNLAEVLSNTATLIRDRFRVLGDIATFTAQGRLTGTILAALPLAMALFMLATAPEYFRPMIETDKGRSALLVAGIAQILGFLVIHKIVRIRV